MTLGLSASAAATRGGVTETFRRRWLLHGIA
jgi:hypothetical protein